MDRKPTVAVLVVSNGAAYAEEVPAISEVHRFIIQLVLRS